MSFIQIFECQTSEADKIQALSDEWAASTEGIRTARRVILAQDRNDPSRYFSIVFFDSYESAMENSNLPETQALAEKLGALVGSPVFHDLDVVTDQT